jgi:hypothetical protein
MKSAAVFRRRQQADSATRQPPKAIEPVEPPRDEKVGQLAIVNGWNGAARRPPRVEEIDAHIHIYRARGVDSATDDRCINLKLRYKRPSPVVVAGTVIACS